MGGSLKETARILAAQALGVEEDDLTPSLIEKWRKKQNLPIDPHSGDSRGGYHVLGKAISRQEAAEDATAMKEFLKEAVV
ncbi:hypothetical protein KKA15_00260 [Patescibacteria group bacterium]|nr:hypothetical protein [Patescibacteria group bacterium]